MIRPSRKLKRQPNKKNMIDVARKTIGADKPEAAPTAQPTRKRGRKPGTRFPGGYKRGHMEDAINTPPAAPPPQPEAQPDILADLAGPGPAQAGQGGAAPGDPGAFDPSSLLGIFGELDAAPMVQDLATMVFNETLAESRGEYWRRTPAQRKRVSGVLTEVLNESAPQLLASKWAYRVAVLALVVGPPLMMDIAHHRENYDWLFAIARPLQGFLKRKKDNERTEPRAAESTGAGTADAAHNNANPPEYNADSGPTGSREDVVMQADSVQA
jgi:hypothetical protein